MNTVTIIFAVVLTAVAAQVSATASVPSLNNCPDMIFIDGNENDSVPTNGFGGIFPGSMQQTIQVSPELGLQTYYYYIPTSYLASQAMPILTLWHGAVIDQASIASVAEQTRDLWINAAETHGFIVVAQAATGQALGAPDCAPCGWNGSRDVPVLSAVLNDMDSRYNIESTRSYLWGYSAGGNVIHAVALVNADIFAAYAISGADLGYANFLNYTPANASREIPVYISVGQSDPYYPNPEADVIQFIQAGWQLGKNIWLNEFAGGHEIAANLPSDAWDKICISSVLD